MSDPVASLPTVWGLDPIQLHTRYWASLGVQVVRQGEPSQIVSHAELYLLTDPRSLVLFPLWRLMDVLNWIKPLVVFVRLRDSRQLPESLGMASDEHGRFGGFQAQVDASESPGFQRVVVTPDIEVARLWQSAPDAASGWRRLRRFTPRHDRLTISLPGQIFARDSREEIALLSRQLVRTWKHPDSVVSRATRSSGSVWVDQQNRTAVEASASLIGPVWIGAGRTVPHRATVVGPCIVWDEPSARPQTEPIQWLNIEPAESDAPRENLWKTARRALRKITRS